MRNKCTSLLVWLKHAKEDEIIQTGTTLGHLKQIAYGNRPASPETAARVEAASGGQVQRKELRPDDWMVIWPELAAS